MIITFVSQCEKNALNKTRRVLDSFANRIGSRTWQTMITNDGLNAVKKLLRKTASKNTAVACHWVRSRRQSELVWIVGNRQKFNSEGVIPVNTTKKDVLKFNAENDWHYLPLIKSLVALAGLFHDFGKATSWFQNKLTKNAGKIIGDPLRHEWISCLIICALVEELGDENKNDVGWLISLEEADINETNIYKALDKQYKKAENDKSKKIFADLPDFVGAIVWLIISHHRLPLTYDDGWVGEEALTIKQMLKRITPKWGYENRFNEEEYKSNLCQCFEFPQGLPSRSTKWLKQTKRWAAKAKGCLNLMQQAMDDGSIRIVLFHARMCLMLSDHFYSSQPANSKWCGELNLFANTDPKTKKLKQKLDEHLVEVAANALKIAHLLPDFEKEPPFVNDVNALKTRSALGFRWQDKAVDKIKLWKKQFPEFSKNGRFGFFAVNMASTGCGKTFANAKIMRVLSNDSKSLRYILALGLRTLTLQTGDEYRSRINLDETELAVLIGSKAVMDLHLGNKKLLEEEVEKLNESSGSESCETFLDEEIDYDCNIPEKRLSTILREERDRKFLYAPVLACTIDHIMGATETKRGGRYILPALRLMSSDLVIDEVDDFDGKDLIAIGRLIHVAGMLGRKVMISSATIPPDLAEGYLNIYREGWSLFSKTREVSACIGCAWIDEFTTKTETVIDHDTNKAIASYRKFHTKFIEKRIKKLKEQPVRRKAEIVDCTELYLDNKSERGSVKQAYFEKIKKVIIEKHIKHNTKDTQTDKLVSFGVVRVANIEPCIELSEYLIHTKWPGDVDPKIMVYHSRQVLLLRNEQEKHLDEVLKRNEKEETTFKNSVIREHIDSSNTDSVIFILVATPVEEVGRDHDFDWAVIEPSSFRSFIQLSGRVLRHRTKFPECANISILQYNMRTLKSGNDKPAYRWPGYEDGDRFKLITHNLKKLVDEKSISKCIDATPRIKRNEPLRPHESLTDLEHHVISSLLTSYDNVGPESMQGWLTQHWWLTALPQQLNRFREGQPTIKLYLHYNSNSIVFVEKDNKGNIHKSENIYGIKHDNLDVKPSRLWLKRDYILLLENIVDTKEDISMMTASLKYGEINFPDYENIQVNYIYSDRFGLRKDINKQ